MVQIDEALTRRVAELARLELSADEVRTFTAQLADILKYVDQLAQVDVSGVEPLTQPVPLETPLREDVAIPSPRDGEGRPKVLGAAPEVIDGGFKVPPIL
jgi:aspartyl-tRNA(Asn)/glutamyl-tRNA(Gln) amidotransferase subunit C